MTGVVVVLLLGVASEEAVDATTGAAEGIFVLVPVLEVSMLTATTVSGADELSEKLVGT